MTYSEKLKDPRWQKKRLEIMQRDEFRCILCKDGKSTLHVHHLEYNGEPWEQDSSKLQTLCEVCHNISEGIKGNHRLESLIKVEKINQDGFVLALTTHQQNKCIYLFNGIECIGSIRFSESNYESIINFFKG